MEKTKNDIRVCHITQYLKHPDSGEELINIKEMEKVLNEWKIIDKYAYILHDSDSFIDSEGNVVLKPPHVHIALKFNSATNFTSIANKFNIESHYIEKSKLRGEKGFLSILAYLTHVMPGEQLKGKFLYPSNRVISNFDYDNYIKDYVDKHSKNLSNESGKIVLEMLLNNEITLDIIKNRYSQYYIENINLIEKIESKRLENLQFPTNRINYYLSGNSGVGKSLMSIMLAKSLFPDIENANDIYHIVSDYRVPFQGYRGQPVLIWEDARAETLLKVLGGRGGVFRVFDNFPKPSADNVKYGSVRLVNKVNIVNGIESFEDFLDGLVASYENGKNEYKAEEDIQAYRRFPMILEIKDKTFDIYMNKGIVNDNALEYKEYLTFRGFYKGSLGAIQKLENIKLKIEITNKITMPIIEKHKEIEEKFNKQTNITDAEIIESFENGFKNQNIEISDTIESPSYYLVRFENILSDYIEKSNNLMVLRSNNNIDKFEMSIKKLKTKFYDLYDKYFEYIGKNKLNFPAYCYQTFKLDYLEFFVNELRNEIDKNKYEKNNK